MVNDLTQKRMDATFINVGAGHPPVPSWIARKIELGTFIEI